MSVRTEWREQPDRVAELLQHGGEVAARVASELTRSDVRHVLMAARGTSDNVARYAQYVWGARNGLPVILGTPSLFSVYDRPIDLSTAAVVIVSQSGRSPDLLTVADTARTARRPVIAITNAVDSPLAELADVVVDVHAGPERAVAATKSYTASLVTVAQVSEALAGGPSVLDGLPRLLAEALATAADLEPHPSLATSDRALVVGRGWHLATAHEWALKLQELTGIIAQAWSTADLAHGPIAAVGPGTPILVAGTRDETWADTVALVRRLAEERGAPVTVIADRPLDLPPAVRVTTAPMTTPWLSPIVLAPFGQRIAIDVAARRGRDPDRPLGLQKITRTR